MPIGEPGVVACDDRGDEAPETSRVSCRCHACACRRMIDAWPAAVQVGLHRVRDLADVVQLPGDPGDLGPAEGGRESCRRFGDGGQMIRQPFPSALG